jgi:hypothetical protein
VQPYAYDTAAFQGTATSPFPHWCGSSRTYDCGRPIDEMREAPLRPYARDHPVVPHSVPLWLFHYKLRALTLPARLVFELRYLRRRDFFEQAVHDDFVHQYVGWVEKRQRRGPIATRMVGRCRRGSLTHPTFSSPALTPGFVVFPLRGHLQSCRSLCLPPFPPGHYLFWLRP